MWHTIDDWLLRGLVPYLDDGDVYRLWIFAEEYGFDSMRNYYLTVSCVRAPLSQTRAIYLAMGYACWTAVCRLIKPPHRQRLSKRSVDDIIEEIQRHVTVPLRHHPNRHTAMTTATPPGSLPAYAMYFAVQQGDLESVIWLHHVARYDPPEALRVAARHDHVRVIEWLLDNAHTARWLLSECVVEQIFRIEDDPALGVLAWRATSRGTSHVSAFTQQWGFAGTDVWGSTSHGVVDLPAMRGDLESMKRLLSHDGFQDNSPRRTVEHAVRGGHLNIIQWFYERDKDMFDDSDFLSEAAVHGQLEVARWIARHTMHRAWMRRVFDGVVRHGHVHVLQWLTEAFSETAAVLINDNLFNLACQQGHLATAQWFVEARGMTIGRKHLKSAAIGGHIELFQWLLARFQQGCAEPFQWDPLWLDGAAESGNLTFVRWLVDDCGLWSPSAVVVAMSPEVAEYLHSYALLHNRPQADISSVECAATIRDGAFEMITWLLQHGLRANHFDKKWFDHIPDFETLFTRKQDQLGWSEDYTPARESLWPQTPTAMARVREMVRVTIDVYDPEFLRSITWLPAWAVQYGTLKNLERLAEIEHTEVFTPAVFRLLLGVSTNADKAQWFLTKTPSLFSTNVVQWAVQYDKRRLLTWLLEEFVPARERELGPDANLSFRCVQTALRSAQKCGRDEIAQWLEATAPVGGVLFKSDGDDPQFHLSSPDYRSRWGFKHERWRTRRRCGRSHTVAPIDDWLLRKLLSYLDKGHVYRLWVFAEEHDLDRVRDFLTVSSVHAPLSQTRARHLAMGYSCWTAVCRLTNARPSHSLSRPTVGHVLHEIKRLVVRLRPHPERATAMLTVAACGTIPQFVMYFAAKQDNLESVIWLHHVARYDSSEALEIAARHGHGRVVTWLLDNARTAQLVNSYGRVEPVFRDQDEPKMGVVTWRVWEYGQVHQYVFTEKWGVAGAHYSGFSEHKVIDLAACHGDLDGIQRLVAHEAFKNEYTSRSVDEAARAGHLHVLKWLCASLPDAFKGATPLECATTNGHLHCAQWLAAHTLADESIPAMSNQVVANGHLEVLQWMVAEFPTVFPLESCKSLVGVACHRGHLAIAQWLKARDRSVATYNDLFMTARGGHLKIMLWLFERFPSDRNAYDPLNATLLDQAAKSGSLELVRWLVEEREVWSPTSLLLAASHDNDSVIDFLYKYAMTHGKTLPGPSRRHWDYDPFTRVDECDGYIGRREFAASIHHGDFAALTWLLTHDLATSQFIPSGFDRLKHLDDSFETQMEQLGWLEDPPARARWPRTFATMARFRALMQLIIDVCEPAFLCATAWLPEWAVQHGTVQNLERLASIKHTKIFAPKPFRVLLRTSADVAKVKWFLGKCPNAFSTRVVQWAVRFDKRVFLSWLWDHFVPTCVGFDAALRQRCAGTVTVSARKYGRVEILEWWRLREC